MHKMRLLSAYLASNTGLPREVFRAYADRGRLETTGRNLGNLIEVGLLRYDAVIAIERCHLDAHAVIALVLAWLADNDSGRDAVGLQDPDLDVALNDDLTADLELVVEFEEPLLLRPDASGPIPFNGRRWSLATEDIDVAEELACLTGVSLV